LPYCKQQALVAMVTMQALNKPKPLLCKGWKSSLQLTNLNLNHFKMVEGMRLKIIA
jgi:hypothetical protein